jgi:hypothetical protein
MTSAPQKAEDFEIAWSGAKADVLMPQFEKNQYQQATENEDEISVKRKTQLIRFFTEFCEHDDFHRRLNDKQFKNEGKFRDGNGGRATIWAFKAWQWRIYGSIMTIKGRRCFVGVKIDPDKKQDRADQNTLKATAKIIGALAEYATK